MVRVFGFGTLVLALTVAGCGSSDISSPTPIPRPGAPPARLLTYSGTIQPQGVSSFAFGVATAGQVEVTLLGAELVTGPTDPPLTLGLGIGTASSGGACLILRSVNVQAGTAAQLSGTGQEGALCVSVFDIGTLIGPANFTLTVATP